MDGQLFAATQEMLSDHGNALLTFQYHITKVWDVKLTCKQCGLLKSCFHLFLTEQEAGIEVADLITDQLHSTSIS